VPAKRLLRYRVPFGFLFAGWYFWLSRYASGQNLGICTLLVTAGCALRAWAAGYLLKGKRVAVGGPYAYVRNPLYLGSFIIGVGFCTVLLTPPVPVSVWLFCAVFLAGFIGMYAAKGKAEENELRRALGAEYDLYRSKVPAILPLRGRVRGIGVQHYSADLYRRNREYQCFWGSIAVLTFLYWRTLHGA
jgi:protein-S-isoprenylcysteine O-methyltransferase Ste14